MIETFFGTGRLDTPAAFLAAFLIGLAFGVALERAGFGSSRRLAGIFYLRDMTVLKVMATSVVTALLGLSFVTALGWVAWDQIYLIPTAFGAQAVGGLIFGVGFVASGWCPGTAAVGTASGKVDALVFLGGAVGGSILFNELYALVTPLYQWGSSGVSLAYEALGVERGAFVLALVAVALASMWMAELVERRVAGTGAYLGSRFLGVFTTAGLVLALGVFLLPPEPAASQAQVAAAAGDDAEVQLLGAIEAAADHVEPEDLADRILAAEDGLLVIDVRSALEYAAFHLRGAVHVPLPELHAYLAPRRNAGTVVLYSNGMTHPAQARDSLARAGHENVYFLTEGLTGFVERCLMPVSLRPSPVSPELAERLRTWRAYFEAPEPALAEPVAAVGADAPPLPGLIDTDWLAQHLGAADLAVVDVRDQKDYNGGHVPGALSLQVESVRGNQGGLPSMLDPVEVLAHLVSRMGIRPTDTVVLVAPAGKLRDATLVGLAFERLDHERYGVLDGGYEKWMHEARPVNTLLPVPEPADYPAFPTADSFSVDRATVLTESRRGTLILDSRPQDAFTGAVREEARGGHIPGAVNRPYTLDLAEPGSDTSLLAREALESAYSALIPSKDSPVIVHCRTGHQASQTWFVLTRVLGYRDVRWYDGGWTEWASRPELPVSIL